MKIPFLLSVWILFLPLFVTAADDAAADAPPQNSERPGAPGAGTRSGNRRSGGFEAMRRNMETLKQKFPEEYEALEELRESGDRRAAMEKMRELMKKAGIEMPAMRSSRRRDDGEGADGGGAPPPASRREPLKDFFAALEKADAETFKSIRLIQQTEPEKALDRYRELAGKHKIEIPTELTVEALRGIEILPRDVVKATMRKLDRELRNAFPEDFAALQELRETDPSAARAEFRRLLQKARLAVEMVKPNAVGLQVSGTSATVGTANSTGR